MEIAKGYFLNKIVNQFLSNYINDFVLDIGGDVFVFSRDNRRVYKVGVLDPVFTDRLAVIIETTNYFVFTSGTYERYFEYNNISYSHIINPLTGVPLSGRKSCTVLSDDAVRSDVLATTFLIITSPVIRQMLLKRFLNVEMILIDENGVSFVTERLRSMINSRKGMEN